MHTENSVDSATNFVFETYVSLRHALELMGSALRIARRVRSRVPHWTRIKWRSRPAIARDWMPLLLASIRWSSLLVLVALWMSHTARGHRASHSFLLSTHATPTSTVALYTYARDHDQALIAIRRQRRAHFWALGIFLCARRAGHHHHSHFFLRTAAVFMRVACALARCDAQR